VKFQPSVIQTNRLPTFSIFTQSRYSGKPQYPFRALFKVRTSANKKQ